MVAGTFHNYSGLLLAIDPTASTVTLKDLATKKTVTITVTTNSDMRRIPTMAAQMIAARMKGVPMGTGSGVSSGRGTGTVGAAPDGAGRTGRAGADLSQMLSRLPKEALSGLKPGDAVMIVATSPVDSARSSAVTLLAGVEPILTASPEGEMTLSPWSVGGGAPDSGGGEP
jgi:hypothetical protein